MTTRTYRVLVSGQFAALTPAVREHLRSEQADHDVFASAFTAAGTFTYTPTLTRFTLRYLLDCAENSAAEADGDVVVEAELLAEEFLRARGIGHRPLTVSAVCLQDVKVRARA